MQGIGRYDLALDIDVFEQGAQLRDFVAFPGDFLLRDSRTLAMHKRTEEMDLRPVFPDCAFEHFAIDGHRFKSGDAQQPGTDSGIQSLDMGTLQDATDRRLGGRYESLCPGIESGANTLQLRLGQPSAPLGYRGITFRLGEDGGHGHRQDGREGVLLAPRFTGIRKAEEDLAVSPRFPTFWKVVADEARLWGLSGYQAGCQRWGSRSERSAALAEGMRVSTSLR